MGFKGGVRAGCHRRVWRSCRLRLKPGRAAAADRVGRRSHPAFDGRRYLLSSSRSVEDRLLPRFQVAQFPEPVLQLMLLFVGATGCAAAGEDTQTPITTGRHADHRPPSRRFILRTQWVPHCGRPTLACSSWVLVNSARLPPSRLGARISRAAAASDMWPRATTLRFGLYSVGAGPTSNP